MNSVFRVYKYPTDYTAFTGKTLTPGEFVELYPTDVHDNLEISDELNNYPNPFNSSTTINYQLSAANNIQLKVYDVFGREIITLVNIYQEAGAYSVSLNAKEMGLFEGIYYYRITSGNSTISKKMILVR